MNAIIRSSAFGLALCTVCTALSAHAQARPDSKLGMGLAMGMGGPSAVSIDGRSVNEGSAALTFGADLTISQALIRETLAAVLRGRIATWPDDWSSGRGESRSRFDLALGPELRWERPLRHGRTVWRLSLPIGITWAWISPGESRAVREAYDNGHGWSAGVVGGVDISGPRQGGYIELEFSTHWTSFRRSATLVSAPETTLRQDYRISDSALLLNGGYEFWLW